MTGKRTVPNVFIKGNSIGGGTETAELYQSGRLQELLEEHGLLKKWGSSNNPIQYSTQCADLWRCASD